MLIYIIDIFSLFKTVEKHDIQMIKIAVDIAIAVIVSKQKDFLFIERVDSFEHITRLSRLRMNFRTKNKTKMHYKVPHSCAWFRDYSRCNDLSSIFPKNQRGSAVNLEIVT